MLSASNVLFLKFLSLSSQILNKFSKLIVRDCTKVVYRATPCSLFSNLLFILAP